MLRIQSNPDAVSRHGLSAVLLVWFCRTEALVGRRVSAFAAVSRVRRVSVRGVQASCAWLHLCAAACAVHHRGTGAGGCGHICDSGSPDPWPDPWPGRYPTSCVRWRVVFSVVFLLLSHVSLCFVGCLLWYYFIWVQMCITFFLTVSLCSKWLV